MQNVPSPFSQTTNNLQLVWDATSLNALMTCPRKYQLGIIHGWRTSGASVDLEFGIYFASAVETYKKARLLGKSKEEATLEAVRYVVEASWIPAGSCDACAHDELAHLTCDSCMAQGQGWGGTYEEQWHCTGTEKYKNAKGHAAKCPWSHKGKWFPAPAPTTCGECGSPTETHRRYVPAHPTKNRKTLVRLVTWYCDDQPQDLNIGLAPVKFPDGTPAVELSFKLPLPYKTQAGETYVLAGYLDSIMESVGQDERFISDNKTTKNVLGPGYYKQFSPNVQVDTYDFVGSVLYEPFNIKGVMIESAQTLVGGANFGQQLLYRTDSQRQEYLDELEYWLSQAEHFAKQNYWPMNRTNCKMCQFQTVCSKPPARREEFLQADFVKRPWNPLEER